MKTLSSFNFKDKRVLVRSDLNSNVVNKKVLMSERIEESSITIKELKNKGAKVVIIAHQGRPGKDTCVSLKSHAKLLSKFVKVKFVDDLFGEKAVKQIKNLKSGEVLLLENVRFSKEEFKPRRNKFVKTLAPLFDIYVNDAFSNSHRKHSSMISFPKYIKNKCAGRILEREVKALDKIKIKNCLYVLGGAKPEDNIKLLGKNDVLACGLFGQTCLIAKGKNLGAQNKYLKKELILNNKIKRKLKRKLKRVKTPIDFAVKVQGRRKEIPLEEFPSKYEIYDIGSKTIKEYTDIIKKAKAVYMKGPAGASSEAKFSKGTVAILKAISQIKGFSVIGGGHLSDTIEKSRINKKKFNHISLSGGALLRYIAGEKLPGVEVLK